MTYEAKPVTERLCLSTCRNFSHEVSSVVTAEGWSDVETSAFPARCGRPPLAWDDLRMLVPDGCKQLVLFGSSCLAGLGDPPPDFPATRIVKVQQCFHLVAGRKLVDEAIVSGGYLITPAWLAEWRKNLAEMGFVPENANDFFRDFAKELVLLDTGINQKSVPDFTELRKTISLDARRIPIGLDYLQLFLTRFVMDWRSEMEKQAAKEREQLNAVKLADQASAMDMLTRLAKIQNEDEAIEAIKELFHMLFAPEVFYYLKVENEIPVPEQLIPAEIQAKMVDLQEDYALLPDGRGFLLRIEHGNELLGVVAVDQLAFPEYRLRYLNMALAVIDVYALAVKNAREVTERKRVKKEMQVFEKQLLQTQKLESLGVLAGGIAHDFNNILTIIIGYCGLIKSNYKLAEEKISSIEIAAERAAGLCRQMLTYAGKVHLDPARIDFKILVDEMVSMLKETLPKNAVINTEIAADISEIIADAGQISQVVMNLIINASEAIGNDQGEIKVSLSDVVVTEVNSFKDYNGTLIKPGKYVCLKVADNGCGMDEETKWRIFEPFYTTKFPGRGLGLSAVLGIIASHHGAVQLHSLSGQGTTFKVYLPAQSVVSALNSAADKTIPAVQWQGSGTILLVEDEEQIRRIAKALLQTLGFTVLEAVNGKEAFELYENHSQDITLVLTDVGMPVMDGYELVCKLKSLNAKLPIIISSGFGDAEVSTRIGSDNIAGLISKPYNHAQLRDVLKTVLEGSR